MVDKCCRCLRVSVFALFFGAHFLFARVDKIVIVDAYGHVDPAEVHRQLGLHSSYRIDGPNHLSFDLTNKDANLERFGGPVSRLVASDDNEIHLVPDAKGETLGLGAYSGQMAVIQDQTGQVSSLLALYYAVEWNPFSKETPWTMTPRWVDVTKVQMPNDVFGAFASAEKLAVGLAGGIFPVEALNFVEGDSIPGGTIEVVGHGSLMSAANASKTRKPTALRRLVVPVISLKVVITKHTIEEEEWLLYLQQFNNPVVKPLEWPEGLVEPVGKPDGEYLKNILATLRRASGRKPLSRAGGEIADISRLVGQYRGGKKYPRNYEMISVASQRVNGIAPRRSVIAFPIGGGISGLYSLKSVLVGSESKIEPPVLLEEIDTTALDDAVIGGGPLRELVFGRQVQPIDLGPGGEPHVLASGRFTSYEVDAGKIFGRLGYDVWGPAYGGEADHGPYRIEPTSVRVELADITTPFEWPNLAPVEMLFQIDEQRTPVWVVGYSNAVDPKLGGVPPGVKMGDVVAQTLVGEYDSTDLRAFFSPDTSADDLAKIDLTLYAIELPPNSLRSSGVAISGTAERGKLERQVTKLMQPVARPVRLSAAAGATLEERLAFVRAGFVRVVPVVEPQPGNEKVETAPPTDCPPAVAEAAGGVKKRRWSILHPFGGGSR